MCTLLKIEGGIKAIKLGKLGLNQRMIECLPNILCNFQCTADNKTFLNPFKNSHTYRCSNIYLLLEKSGNVDKINGVRFTNIKTLLSYLSFGLSTFNEKGCSNKNCAYFHPNACRDSLKTNTCPRSECRFYHLTGSFSLIKAPLKRK